MRKQIERLLPEFFPLKSGYTTGACATAAAKAALLALLTREEQTESQITLPSGEQITLSVAYTEWAGCSATCTVIKESGDDPDVTIIAGSGLLFNYLSIHPGWCHRRGRVGATVMAQLVPSRGSKRATVMAQEEYCQETESDDTEESSSKQVKESEP